MRSKSLTSKYVYTYKKDFYTETSAALQVKFRSFPNVVCNCRKYVTDCLPVSSEKYY